MSASSGRDLELPPGTSALGMKVMLASLAVLFASALASYWVVRGESAYWDQGLPSLPWGLWVSTGLLALSSWGAQRALGRMRLSGCAAALPWLRFSGALALAFLLVQVLNWRAVAAAHLGPATKNLYSFTFYLLTSLHALHVLGGVIFHAQVLHRARLGGYSQARHDGVRNLVVYWHFLGLTWIALYATLLLGAQPSLTPSAIVHGSSWVAAAGGLLFILCWLRVEAVLLRREGPYALLVGLLPPVAFLRAFMKADLFHLRPTLFWWAIGFGLALSSGATALAVSLFHATVG